MVAPSPHDERVRIVSVALEPALVLARALAIPLDELLDAVAVGYFRAHQERGLSFTAIARRLGKSRRSIAHLAKAAKTSGADQPGHAITLRRQLVERLGRHGLSDLRALRRHFSKADRGQLDQELEVLVQSGVVEFGGGGYRVAAPFLSLVGKDLDQRLDSLRQFMVAVAHGVYQRFFAQAGQTDSLARVLAFRASRGDLQQLGSDTYRELRRAVLEADEQACRPSASAKALTCSAILLVTEHPKGPAFDD